MKGERAFFEIGARTNFSFLEGASSPEEMVLQAAYLRLGGLGIADRNSVAGVVRAHAQAEQIEERYKNRDAILAEAEKTGKKEGIFHPIRIQPGARLVFSDDTPDILAYPCNRRGWANLCRLLSAGNLKEEAVKGSCILTEAELMEWGDEMMLALVADRTLVESQAGQTALEDYLERFRRRFRKALFMVLAPAYDGRDRQVFAVLAMLAARNRVPLIATNQPLYHHPERRPLSDVVIAIREHVQISQAGFLLAPNAERYLKDSREMVRIFGDYPDAVENTQVFFGKLSFSLKELQHNYPSENDPGETPQETLERLTRAGAAKRYPQGVPSKVAKQIDYELKLIGDKNYASYFLTVHRIIQHARYDLKVLCQGRGSAANSVICYCLEITEVDPQKSTLLFDRFISMDRDEPPDIDVDFEHDRREEVIQFIYRRYGIDHAGLTAGVTTYRTRSAGREVAKAFGLSEDVQSAISSLVWGWSEDNLSERDAKAAGLDVKDPVTQNVLQYASELLGFPRHLTQHVGGFVITRDRLDEVVPIMKTAMPDRYMIEWDKDDLDNVKILKVDVLALGMLTCLRKAFSLLELHYDVKKTLADLGNREHGDEGKPVYEMMGRADTLGVFQIESRAQMSMLPRLKPKIFYDLVIEVAIVRPGPIQGDMVHPYLKRREQRARNIPIEYPSKELEAVLERTLGVPLFQEQAMQIAITAAGFRPAEADKLRRAMATFKRTGTIGDFEKRFIEGMVSKDYEPEFAKQCFNQIKGFGEYGFPESHAASFALLVYASSWLKAYYPDVFCAAMLNSQPMGFYAPAQLVRDAREHGVRILAVDINESEWDCTLEEAVFDRKTVDFRHGQMREIIKTRHAVRLGFRQIKGLSSDDMKRLVGNRGQGYGSVRDLWLRSGLPKSVIERLADADAFRSIHLSRREALWAVRALDVKSAAEELPLFEQVRHIDLQPEPAAKLPDMLPGEQVIEDYRYLSLSLKAHPVSFLREELRKAGITRNVDLLSVPNGKRVTIAGLVLVRQRPGSAKGVIFMTLEDETGVANAIVWNAMFDKYRAVVMGARLVKIRGRLQSHSGVIHTVVEHIEDMTPALGILQREARRFGACERSDEVLRPGGDPRQAAEVRKGAGLEKRMIAEGRHAGVAETAQVMPRGRNFH
ncbi:MULTISPECIES: error-prone DNA polymerase [Rhizobium]|uniref:Error-prone DNA polymerase n=1 Tax=Rhizobium phaseoli TaxID=396 RepID=A0A192TF77_9HYPH|nr:MULTISPECIES: error-prone DNA polymerase [Rhizobium]ANL55366.1 error-prone DNA polymerase 1 [Rhizobium phaseoli]ANL86979.1 error-prone DNA polymerase 1 [Rhizobium phaseoli]ANL93488.1 error-prone DNA polymerase 1 [Rhizobium phaseoli]MDE8760997.1 error-prone DNA polymerase [Rhizobium sp. CBK13]MDK4725944.1 error-prone DNA polymerase [Rhizobium phaseoli]